jgi:hypothetical protein
MWSVLDAWMNTAPTIFIGGAVFVLMVISLVAGSLLRRWCYGADAARTPRRWESSEGTVIAAVLTLLALLLGFSFNLAIQRFEARRILVVEQASAIEALYMRAQLLPEPHRQRISGILRAYTDDTIALATARAAQRPPLLASSDARLDDLWAAITASIPSLKGLDVSNSFLSEADSLMTFSAEKRDARTVHIPSEIFVILFFYMIVSAGLLGYLSIGMEGRLTSGLVLTLMAAFLLLVIDIDRPTEGVVRESPAPLLVVRDKLAAGRQGAFDRYKTSVGAGAAAMARR